MVYSQVLTSEWIEKEFVENTLADNKLAQQGATSGYSFPTKEPTFNCECVCHEVNS